MKKLLIFIVLVFAVKWVLTNSYNIAERDCTLTAKQVFLSKLQKDLFIRFPKVVLAQMCHETAFFSSKIYKENKNCVGMKWNSRGYATGVNRGHAKYSSVWDCLKDYADWQNKYCPDSIKSDEEYIDWLIRFGYAEDKEYKQHLTRTLSILNND